MEFPNMKHSILDSRLVSVGIASLVAVGVIGFGSIALAQDSGDTTPPAESTTSDEPRVKPGKALHSIRSLISGAGVTGEEVQAGKEAGLTWGEIIDQYGDISAAEAKANALAEMEAKLAEAVANGRIEQERADEILANAPAHLDEFLASTPGEHRPHLPAKVGRFAIQTVADVLGIEPSALIQQMQAGQTIAEIAGGETQAVIDALVAEGNAKLDEAVENGRLDAERAAELKTALPARAEQFVNTQHPGREAIGRVRDRLGERGIGDRQFRRGPWEELLPQGATD
jgi:hypothetical protein